MEMEVSTRYLERTLEDFQREHMAHECFSSGYACSMSALGQHDKEASAETQTDWCISVTLREPLPAGVTLPEKYRGMKVFTTVNPQPVVPQ